MKKWMLLTTGIVLILYAGGVAHPGTKTEVSPQQKDWKPVQGKILTRWAQDVSPDSVHSEYPRPQMVREEWLNLNGLWDYAIQPKGRRKVEEFQGRILVPFPVESALSGVGKAVGGENQLWYRRTFEVPDTWRTRHIRLNFEAVDWETTVWINGQKVGNPPWRL